MHAGIIGRPPPARERAALLCAMAGMTNGETARVMSVSRQMVEYWRTHTITRYQVPNTTAAAVQALLQRDVLTDEVRSFLSARDPAAWIAAYSARTDARDGRRRVPRRVCSIERVRA